MLQMLYPRSMHTPHWASDKKPSSGYAVRLFVQDSCRNVATNRQQTDSSAVVTGLATVFAVTGT